MRTLFVGQNMIELAVVSSTNSYAAELIQHSQIIEGTLIYAQHQSNGRGQRGNSWLVEPNKNLTISIVLRPSFLSIHNQFDLNKAISLAVCDFIASYLPQNLKSVCKIKWPNDIHVENKKLGGILIENTVKANQISWSIVGIGLNINQENFSESLVNAISLKQINHIEYELKMLLENLCMSIETRYLQLKLKGIEKINADYLSHLFRLNEFANYVHENIQIRAKIKGVSNYGHLILEKEDNTTISCDFKEISFII
jgi:BirA family biotin operon repressor/biotin-[acetyl-CoA-carboxylase] ligase